MSPATAATAALDTRVAEQALPRYGFGPEHTLRMINLSENATFLVHDDDRSAVLRVHRVGYHTRADIESELSWLAALREESGVATSRVLPNTDDELVTTVVVDGVERHAVLFDVVPGTEPDEIALGTSDFETLGTITAQMHQHARGWTPPPGFHRFSWDWEHTLGDTPRWGRWQDGIDVGPVEETALGAAVQVVRERLSSYGTEPDRFGLVHADLRLANLLVEGDLVTVIDFDDCGLSWFMYDFGTAVSFIEHDPRLPDWQAAWLRGYRSVTDLSSEHEAMLTTFVMLRRLLLVAWMGSHAHSRECQELGPGYTANSVELARRYVASDGASIS
ncbi:phosphotransferase enzyme family protein [Nocardioides sp. NPDC051685]|uniref:phosphotransferase enzyme family protein n=1 Tax=Nocardioides sp. NPDC051685 TaxID=3364334 RepID=UPI00379E555D